jgi:hypothetical protein
MFENFRLGAIVRALIESIRSGSLFLARIFTGGPLLASMQALFHATQAISFRSNWSKVNPLS